MTNNSTKTFNKPDLIKAINKNVLKSNSASIDFVELILGHLIRSVGVEERIEIRNFGVFSRKTIRPRRFINPKTKEIRYLGETSVIHFKQSKTFFNDG